MALHVVKEEAEVMQIVANAARTRRSNQILSGIRPVQID
jgi:hypothetical protein